MTPEQIERCSVAGARWSPASTSRCSRGRGAGERRRYTKRFLNRPTATSGHWTEREWRILARRSGTASAACRTSCSSTVARSRARAARADLRRRRTVDQWATLLRLQRDGHIYRHAFEDRAHRWALEPITAVAPKEIHQLQLVRIPHIKGDNVCIPIRTRELRPRTRTRQRSIRVRPACAIDLRVFADFPARA